MIVVVTGASRGAGKGIAIALGAAGATVYVTGRSTSDSDTQWGGTIHETAELVTKAGGKGVAVAVDHADDAASQPFLIGSQRSMDGSIFSSITRSRRSR